MPHAAHATRKHANSNSKAAEKSAFRHGGAVQHGQHGARKHANSNSKAAEKPAFRAAGVAQHAGRKMLAAGHGNLDALAKSGNQSFGLIQEFDREVMKSGNRAFSEWADLAEAALTCRTINDVIDLQNQAARHWSDNYFETTSRMWNLLFDRWSKTMQPIGERAASNTNQARRPIAA